MTVLAYNKSTDQFLEIEEVEMHGIPEFIQEYTGNRSPLDIAEWKFWDIGDIDAVRFLAKVKYTAQKV